MLMKKDFVDQVLDIVTNGDASEFRAMLPEALNAVLYEERKELRELLALAYIRRRLKSFRLI